MAPKKRPGQGKKKKGQPKPKAPANADVPAGGGENEPTPSAIATPSKPARPAPDVRRKETIVKSPPPIFYPLIGYVAFVAVSYVLGVYEVIPKPIVFSVFALGSFAAMAYVVIAMRWEHTKSKLGTSLIAGWVALCLVGMLLPLVPALHFGEPLVSERLTRDNKLLDFDAPSKGGYLAFLEGHFTKLDEIAEKNAEWKAKLAEIKAEDREMTEEETKHANVRRNDTYSLDGSYKYRIKTESGDSITEGEGVFAASGRKRHISKRSSGYVESHDTTAMVPFRLPATGTYEVNLYYLDESLSKGVDVTIYKWSRSIVLSILVALLALLLGSFIDHLLLPKRVRGWYTFGAGIACGFANFYLLRVATPNTGMSQFVSALMIGGVMGLVAAWAVQLPADRFLWPKIVRNNKISL